MEKDELVLGIDDAGRGPVLGPMCLAGCVMSRNIEEDLKKLGSKDSKMLTPKKREELVKDIKEKCLVHAHRLIFPKEIDSGMGKGLNLNQVEAYAASEIIKELITQISISERKKITIIVDCPSNNKLGWFNQLQGFLKMPDLIIKCEHKADRDYPVVSCASIIAKTTRDSEIEKLKESYGVDFGSGYPHDPKTVEFLKKNVDDEKYDSLFRKSWQTWKDASSKSNNISKQASLGEF